MKRIFILFFVMAVLMVYFTACIKKPSDSRVEKSTETDREEEELKQIFFGEFIADNTINLDDPLIKEYKIEELNEFFAGRNGNEGSWNNSEESSLTLSEVNQQYPLEIIRTKDYSVYKVEEGGCFYVFWVRTFTYDEEHIESDRTELDPRVYFTAYLNEPVDKSLFKRLKVNKSTFADVKEIDPYAELCLLLSRGTYSYSYLNNEEVLEVEYTIKDSKKNSKKNSMNNYDDLVVKKIEVVPRMESASRFASILPKDLPEMFSYSGGGMGSWKNFDDTDMEDLARTDHKMYYDKNDFKTIVIGESTYKELYDIAPVDSVQVTSYGGACRYPMEDGGCISIKLYGSEWVVGEIEVSPPKAD